MVLSYWNFCQFLSKNAIISPLDANRACMMPIPVFLGSKLPKLGRRLFFGAFILEFLSIFVKNAIISPLDANGACILVIRVFFGVQKAKKGWWLIMVVGY